MTESQRRLVLGAMETIEYHLNIATLKYPKLCRDDVRSEFYLQACGSAERFNPELGHKFKTMLAHRLRGATIDMVRIAIGNRNPELRARRTIDARENSDYISDSISHEDNFISSLEYQRLLKCLAPRDREMLKCELLGMTRAEAGAVLGVNESRASQLHTRMIERLAAHA